MQVLMQPLQHLSNTGVEATPSFGRRTGVQTPQAGPALAEAPFAEALSHTVSPQPVQIVGDGR